jgi:hypothetical protein
LWLDRRSGRSIRQEERQMTDETLEAAEADAAEQQASAVPAGSPDGEPEDQDAGRARVPLEADAADTAEQGREIRLDEDEDYR